MAILKRALVVAVAGIAVSGLGLALLAAEGREAATSIIGTASAAEAQSSTQAAYDDSGFRLGEATLTPSERAGREIWYKSTAGNARFHTYVFQQRVGVLIDWFRVLKSTARDDRFAAYGLINDPGCCTPGSKGCPASKLEDTYGFD